MFEHLNSFASVEIFENSIFAWGTALLTTLLIYLILSVLFRLVRARLASLSPKTANITDDLLTVMLGGTRRWCLFLFALWGGSQVLALGPRATGFFDLLLVFGLTVQVALWANRFCVAYIEHYANVRREVDPGAVATMQVLSYVVRLLIWSIALLLVIDNLGYDVTALVAGLGIGGVAIALALQNILGDLFASLSITLDKPFVPGDFIVVGDLLGAVERIGIKTTRVRSLSGEQLVFSNADLLSSRIRNFKRMEERRIAFGFGVLYQTKPEQLEAIPLKIRAIVEGIENTRFDRAHFKGFGESSFDFEVVYYIGTPDYNVYMDIQQAINLAICRCFDEMGVEFAYPTRTIYINSDES
ncbi:MAG: mechanosensitive ion channel family protein, partial [Opitutales bacterium]